MIAICCAEPLAPCTNGRLSGCTDNDVLLPIQPPNLVAETVVEVSFQVADVGLRAGRGIPPLQLARGTLNFRQCGLNAGLVAVAMFPSQPWLWLSTYTSPV